MHFFGSKKKRPEHRLLRSAGPSAEQKRSAFRMPVEFGIVYTLEGRAGRRSARAKDLSAGGLQLSCDEDLPLGSQLLLDFKLPADFLASLTVEKEVYEQSPFGLRPETVKVTPPGFTPMRLRAQVLGAVFEMQRRSFGYGLGFVEIDPKDREELQRFMHLWQIHYLRTRRGDLE